MKNELQYRIEWKSRITDYQGQGLYIFSLERCQEECDTLNGQYKDILHWPGKRPEVEQC